MLKEKVHRFESEERRIGQRMEPARKRRVSPVWEHFDLIIHNGVPGVFMSCPAEMSWCLHKEMKPVVVAKGTAASSGHVEELHSLVID